MARQPTLQEMQEIVKHAEPCLECDAPECHEPTPEGVDFCADLPFWEGRPVTRAMLAQWLLVVNAQPDGKQ